MDYNYSTWSAINYTNSLDSWNASDGNGEWYALNDTTISPVNLEYDILVHATSDVPWPNGYANSTITSDSDASRVTTGAPTNDTESSANGTTCLHDCVIPGSRSPYNWLFLFFLIFVGAGVLGNTLVCLAICLERRLQNVTNYFLMSLSVADLLVSLVVMPFGIIVGFLGYWPFDAITCNIYVTCDVLACSCSIMHMCFISIGRYRGIRNPLKTRNHSKKVVMVKIALVWLLSMVITSPITILGLVDHENILPEVDVCTINNRFFFIFGSLFAFYIPMVFMVVSYVLTVQLLRRQAKFGNNLPNWRMQLSCRHTNSSSGGSNGTGSSRMTRSESRRSFRNDSAVPVGSITFSNNGHLNFQTGLRQNCIGRTATCDRGTQTPVSMAQETSASKCRRARLRSLRLNLPKGASVTGLGLKFFAGRRRSPVTGNTVANEQKASKVLGVVFSTFVVCWTAFFILNIVFAACPSCHVSANIVDASLWLGYISSTINPIIYTIFNRTFKEAFVKFLLCRCVLRKRYSNSHMHHYVDNLLQTPSSRNSVYVKSPSYPSFDGQESIC